MIHALLNAALPLLLATAPATPASVPVLTLESDTVRADLNGTWTIAFGLHNPGAYGLRGDSMFVDYTDRDAGVSRAPRQGTLAFPAFIQHAAEVAAGEDSRVNFSMPAPCERAALVLRLYGHDGGGTRWSCRGKLTAEPGPLALSLPSAFVDVKGRRVEVVCAAAASGPAPGVLLVPSETAHARTLARTAARLAAQGLNVVAVSPPGYGQSAGPADLCGPATLKALEAALARLLALPGTDRNRLAVWGTGRGATAALLLAAHHPEITRVVAQDAGYDLWATWRAADAATAKDIVREAGSDSAAWKARSPLLTPPPAGTQVLVIHGALQDAPTLASRAFVAARAAAGAPVDTLYASPLTRRISKDPFRVASAFLAAPSR